MICSIYAYAHFDYTTLVSDPKQNKVVLKYEKVYQKVTKQGKPKGE